MADRLFITKLLNSLIVNEYRADFSHKTCITDYIGVRLWDHIPVHPQQITFCHFLSSMAERTSAENAIPEVIKDKDVTQLLLLQEVLAPPPP